MTKLARAPWLVAAILALAAAILGAQAPWLLKVPAGFTVPFSSWLGGWAEAAAEVLRPASRGLSGVLEVPMLAIRDLLEWLPWPAIFALIVGLAIISGAGLVVTVVTALSLAYVLLGGFWRPTMNTLALVAVAVPLSLVLGLAGGVAAHYSARARRVVMPLLDLMQTMPTFAYLIPILFLFGFGPVVGLIASAIYASPPMVRNVMLGLERVSSEVVEAGHIAGTSRWQQLVWVELPAARAQVLVGLNQTIMAALSMVIIAAVIGGFDDIGWEVLSAMRKARFGDSLLSGLVIVLIAVVMDRVSAAFAASGRAGRRSAWRWLGLSVIALAVAGRLFGWAAPLEASWTSALASSIDAQLTAFVASAGDALANFKNQGFYYYLLPMRIGFNQTIAPFTWGFVFSPEMRWGYLIVAIALCAVLAWRGRTGLAAAVAVAAYLLYFGLTGASWLVLGAIAFAAANALAGWRVAAFVAVVCAAIAMAGLWEPAMLSIYLCGSATVLAFALGASLGTAGALSDRFSGALRPVLDTFQTIPLFVFLIPVLMLFQIGEFTALLAVVAYAFVPAARYTENGLRQVPAHYIEVAQMQGCSPSQIFWQVKLPLAMPVILLGLNQTVLFAFAMLVIAALVGTTGLGQQVYVALSSADVGAGLVAGTAMALLAMAADRVLSGWARSLGAQDA